MFALQGMYTFMTKFEELHKSFTPMKQLSEQMYPELELNIQKVVQGFIRGGGGGGGIGDFPLLKIPPPPPHKYCNKVVLKRKQQNRDCYSKKVCKTPNGGF